MPALHPTRKVAALALVLLLSGLALAACGSSSTSSSKTSAAASTTPTAPTAPGGRFAAVRECLQRNGIKLPTRKPGQQRPPGVGGFLGGGAGPALPAGVTRSQFEAALKKCGGRDFGARGGRFKSPAYRQALAKFAACMRENGVNLPAPNTSGSGPIFSTKGVNTTSAKFRTADGKCTPILLAARRQNGQGQGAPGGAAPGAPGGGAPEEGAGG